MDDLSLMPDLSHLSAEEREIIEQVLKRQKDEEAKEVQLTLKADAELDQIEKQINERKEIARRLVGTHDDAICQICQKTKFADGIGHKCFYCQLRSCARCGGRSQSKSKAIWACSLCQKRQQILAKTGKWFQPDEGQHKLSYTGQESPSQSIRFSDHILYLDLTGAGSVMHELPTFFLIIRLFYLLSSAGAAVIRHPTDESRSYSRVFSAPVIPGDMLAAKIRTYLSHPVTWQPSADQRRLIGHMVLHKTDNSVSGDLGLKVVGGRRSDNGRLGAFITRVKPGSVADTIGRLKAGQNFTFYFILLHCIDFLTTLLAYYFQTVGFSTTLSLV
ncbi:unnamed protein product [Angiostrongylus costaricensis]|uniref:FYVE-type domain-containing protein n=1 Tax=Angiostrongylus costaricensis TaxID=334426 RepID=A0A158PF68_ANGCS|nr:unnamed protein product [Angiostrongylus costaricensis]